MSTKPCNELSLQLMKRVLRDALVALVLWTGVILGQESECAGDGVSAHNFTLTNIDEVTEIPLSDYEGKVLIIFNVATY